MHHQLTANKETCHWGFFDARRKPVLTIDSGDRVTIDTLSGAPDFIPKSGFHVPSELAEVHAAPSASRAARTSSPAPLPSRARSPDRCWRCGSST